jgi:aryl-alcohol dehydrogenase-like predicted oxidoreductase
MVVTGSSFSRAATDAAYSHSPSIADSNFLTGKYCKGETGRKAGMDGWLFHAEDTPQKIAIVDTLEAIAEEIDSNAGRVVIATGAIPIARPRTCAQLEHNLAAVEVSLTISDWMR